jgi:PilZ domain
MERRNEPRVEANEPVIVTELGASRRYPIGGMIQDISGGGMLIKLSHALALNAPVRIETKDMLLLGEVARCEPDGEEYRIGLMIHHSLRDLQDLEKLNRALMSAETNAEERSTVPIGAPIMRE